MGADAPLFKSITSRDEAAELEAKADTALLAKVERRFDEASAGERIHALEEALAKETEKTTRYEAQHKRWVLGDYSDLAWDHPFEITIQSSEDPAKNWPVDGCVNGKAYRIPRGEPVRVNKSVVQAVAACEIDTYHRVVGPDDNPYTMHKKQNRFPFNAHPIWK